MRAAAAVAVRTAAAVAVLGAAAVAVRGAVAVALRGAVAVALRGATVPVRRVYRATRVQQGGPPAVESDPQSALHIGEDSADAMSVSRSFSK